MHLFYQQKMWLKIWNQITCIGRGELGFFRIETGHDSLGIELEVVWATPGSWTEENVPCYESGGNCGPSSVQAYVDPSMDLDSISKRIQDHKATE